MASKIPDSFISAKVPAGYAVCRNDAILKTPAGHPLIVPAAALAQTIVAEWQAQGEKIKPAGMPMTQLASTAIDIVAKDHDQIAGQLCGYLDSDLLCHFAAQPEALVMRQQAVWQPIIDWCRRRFNIAVQPTSGIMPVAQPAASREALRHAIAAYDAFALTGLRQAADVSGSIILALALAEKQLTAAQVLVAAELEALFQAGQWGEDIDRLARQAGIRRDLEQYEKWFSLIG